MSFRAIQKPSLDGKNEGEKPRSNGREYNRYQYQEKMNQIENYNEMFCFGFGRNISSSTLYRLRNVDCCYLLYGIASIDKYLDFLIKGKPKYVIGLGAYSGSDQDKLRIELNCTNRFRNSYIESDHLKELQINSFLSPNINSKLATGIGNSYCNYVSWKIMELIQSGTLNARYSFIHIPSSMKAWFAAKQIDEMIENIQNNW